MTMTTLLYILIFLILATATYGALSSAPWLPTKKRDVKRMADIADIKKGEIVYDLGCGDGRLIFAVARLGAKAIGIEVFILPYLYACIKKIFYRNVVILYGDFFNYDISQADVVMIFLMPKSYKKIIEKLAKELRPGSRVVVYCFEIEEWKNKLVKVDKEDNQLQVYLYKV